jgi:hypothetical protein
MSDKIVLKYRKPTQYSGSCNEAPLVATSAVYCVNSSAIFSIINNFQHFS